MFVSKSWELGRILTGLLFVSKSWDLDYDQGGSTQAGLRPRLDASRITTEDRRKQDYHQITTEARRKQDYHRGSTQAGLPPDYDRGSTQAGLRLAPHNTHTHTHTHTHIHTHTTTYTTRASSKVLGPAHLGTLPTSRNTARSLPYE